MVCLLFSCPDKVIFLLVPTDYLKVVCFASLWAGFLFSAALFSHPTALVLAIISLLLSVFSSCLLSPSSPDTSRCCNRAPPGRLDACVCVCVFPLPTCFHADCACASFFPISASVAQALFPHRPLFILQSATLSVRMHSLHTSTQPPPLTGPRHPPRFNVLPSLLPSSVSLSPSLVFSVFLARPTSPKQCPLSGMLEGSDGPLGVCLQHSAHTDSASLPAANTQAG